MTREPFDVIAQAIFDFDWPDAGQPPDAESRDIADAVTEALWREGYTIVHTPRLDMGGLK